jgi:hypothetical protein
MVEAVTAPVQVEPIVQDWIFTFGFAHTARGVPARDLYVRINGTYRDARAVMNAYFGNSWCAQYGSEGEAGVQRFNLNELSLKGLTPLDPYKCDVYPYGIDSDAEEG